ncbi:PhzF family phenazine biosynthesis protein [Blastopirellula marina]|uniref:Oxidoreductase n=1 Tax=Blastopirellula marina TaxID=124 RepID=A0A2S8F4I5_9BACT|nr:PhzF family phenazine biosynthesis protein [Blastopirellula marina]PQO27068.1 oxidoreductase [Blastopirellula marina]PTL41215.1 PhzF family phenazine biosynthesis protein [Blastopirellula marina]
MPHTLFQVDAFSLHPFAGNPAAVCLLEGPADESWMQHVAAEMNLSETAFVHPEGDALRLRWFTPAVEVDLCGHATLSAAHILWQVGRFTTDRTIAFETRSGTLTAARVADKIELNFPIAPVSPLTPAEGLLEALGISDVSYCGKNAWDWLIEIPSATTLRQLSPNHALLAPATSRGVMVTAPSDDPRYDFLSRFFAPAYGVPEDPVTGSAHCVLGEYWSKRLGKTTLNAFQASPRGGEVEVEIRNNRALLRGHAVTVAKIELLC